MPENVIAQQAIALASKYSNEDTYRTDFAGPEGTAAQTDALPPRQAYAAYYLLDRKGNKELLDSARECTEPKRYVRPIQLRPRIGMYLGAMAVIFAAFLFVSLWSAAAVNDTAISIGAWTAAALVLVFPVSEWAVTVVHGLIGKVSVTQPLLRYDYASGIDEDAATITVIPFIRHAGKCDCAAGNRFGKQIFQ